MKKAMRYSIWRCPRCRYFAWSGGKKMCEARGKGVLAVPLTDDGRMKDNKCKDWRRK